MTRKEIEEIIKTINEETELDPETLIFDPEKAKKFIAEAQRENPGRIAFLPVRPDWNEAKKVFGYYNPLTGLFYPTDGLLVLLNAFRALMQGKKDEKYFIILDEMNLARVEYYFSDILSLMENWWEIKNNQIIPGERAQIHYLDRCVLSKLPSREKYTEKQTNWSKYVEEEDQTGLVWKNIPEKKCQENCSNCPYYSLVKSKIEKEEIKIVKNKEMEEFIEEFNPIPPRIAYPQNLVIIGTVNVDETTFSFAPKVLDRAFVTEFTEVYWEEYFRRLLKVKENYPNINENGWNAFVNFVKNLQSILKPRNLHFGYRVMEEMLKYLNSIKKEEDREFDFLLKSKILPKLHGTEEQIGDVLIKLLAFCAGKENYEVYSKDKDKDQKFKEEILEEKDKEGKEEKDKEGNWWQLSFDNYKSVFSKYPESAQKIWQMYQNMKATGYCSYF